MGGEEGESCTLDLFMESLSHFVPCPRDAWGRVVKQRCDCRKGEEMRVRASCPISAHMQRSFYVCYKNERSIAHVYGAQLESFKGEKRPTRLGKLCTNTCIQRLDDSLSSLASLLLSAVWIRSDWCGPRSWQSLPRPRSSKPLTCSGQEG